MAASSKHKISILGTGNMGRALGLRFAALGHDVFFAGRDPAGAPSRAAAKAGGTARSGTLNEAASFADILIWTARERDPARVFSSPEAVAQLDGKIVIDLNNRDYADEVVPMMILQTNIPHALIIKAFNTIPMETLDTSAPSLRDSSAQIFVASAPASAGTDHDNARQTVFTLASTLGFTTIDLGSSKTAMRAAEALGDVVRYLIIDRAMGGRANIGVRMLREPDLGLVGAREASDYH